MTAMLSTVVISQTTTAYGQEIVHLNNPNENTARLLAEVINHLQNSTQNQEDTLFAISLHDMGTLQISFNNGTPADFTDDTQIITFHNYTPANGYEFRGDEIIKPDGTPLFQ